MKWYIKHWHRPSAGSTRALPAACAGLGHSQREKGHLPDGNHLFNTPNVGSEQKENIDFMPGCCVVKVQEWRDGMADPRGKEAQGSGMGGGSWREAEMSPPGPALWHRTHSRPAQDPSEPPSSSWLLSPPSPSGFYSLSRHGGSSWKTDWNSKVLTELYGFWHFAFSEAWIFFITDLYSLLVSSSSISNG